MAVNERQQRQPQEQNIYYVKYNTRLTPQQFNQKKSELGLTAIKHATSRPDLLPSAANIVLVSGDIKQIEKDNSIVSINPVEKLELTYDDPFYSETSLYPYNQYFLYNSNSQWTDAISEYGEGDSSPIIGMLDTRTYTGKPSWYAYSGYPDEHIDLEGKIEWNDTNGSPFPGGQSESSKGYHGEAVASLIVGNSNNGIGMVATCPNCTLVSFDWESMSDLNDPDSIMGVLTECIERGIKILNVSLACECSSCSSCYYNPDVQAVINDAYNQGTVMVVAAGNLGLDIQYIGANDFAVYCSYDNVWCVTSDNGRPSEYNWDSSCTYPPILPSAQGATRVDGCTKIDFSAPKAQIAANNLFYFPYTGFDEYGTSVYADTQYDDLPSPALYRDFSGTSGSTPLVSGLAGLLLSHHPNLSLDDIYWIIANSNIEEYDHYNNENSFEGKPGSINFYQALCLSYDDCPFPQYSFPDSPGDLNQDGIINVVDIVMLVDCILTGVCPPTGNWALEDIMIEDCSDETCHIKCNLECAAIGCNCKDTCFNDPSIESCDDCCKNIQDGYNCDDWWCIGGINNYTCDVLEDMFSSSSCNGCFCGNSSADCNGNSPLYTSSDYCLECSNCGGDNKCDCNCDCPVGADVNQDGIYNVVDIITIINIILGRGVLSGSDQQELNRQIQRLLDSNIPTQSEKQQLQQQMIQTNKKQNNEKQILIDRILRKQNGK